MTAKDQLTDVDRASFGRALANAVRWTEETGEVTAVIVSVDGYDYVTVDATTQRDYAVTMMVPVDGIG